MIYRTCLMTLAVVLLVSCERKKKTMTGGDEVNRQEFVDFFPEVTLPFGYADTSFYTTPPDSLLISPEIFNEFTPDSILKANFPDGGAQLYAIGKFKEPDGATYLMLRATGSNQKVMLMTAYDDKQAFIAGFTAMKSKKDKGISSTILIDPRYNINKKTVKRLPNDIEITGDDVYVLNQAIGKFMLILTDSLGDDVALFNPIDTLGRDFKYAADYGTGSRNIISIRDNAKAGRINFFIHLEEKNGACQGELKGEAIIVSDKVVEYRQPGDPCVLQFIFDKGSVTLNEVQGCGSRMGALECTFNGRYPKKKSK